MNDRMTREQKKKLLLAEGALHRFECVQARHAIAAELGNIAHGGPTGVLRAVSGRTLLSVAATALPLVLIDDPLAAFRWSQAVSVGIMFALGIPVARWVGMRPWMGGALFAALGSIITFVCIALGG